MLFNLSFLAALVASVALVEANQTYTFQSYKDAACKTKNGTPVVVGPAKYGTCFPVKAAKSYGLATKGTNTGCLLFLYSDTACSNYVGTADKGTCEKLTTGQVVKSVIVQCGG